MKKDELLAEAREQLRLSAGWTGDTAAMEREKALNAYFMRPRGDERVGRSRVVSGSISAMVDANLAQMQEAYSSDDIAMFEALGALDEDQAQLESATVTHLVMKSENGFLELGKATKQALLLRLGVMKVWVEEKTTVRTRGFVGMTLDAISQWMSQAFQVLSFNQDKGEASIRETVELQRFRSKHVPLSNFYWAKDHVSHDLQDVSFCAERHLDTRSELIKLGVSKSIVKLLPAFHGTGATKPDEFAAKSRGNQLVNLQGAGTAQDYVEWYECYMLVDVDGDGMSERHRVCITAAGDGGLLSDDAVGLVPYAVGVTLVNPDQLPGISDFDKLRQNWDMDTGLQRALLDNVSATTKNRLAYLDGKVNVDDIDAGRPDGSIRVKATVGDVRSAVMPFAVPDTSGNIRANIDANNRQRTELGGAALELATGQAQIGGDRMGSQGLDRAYSVMEQLCAMKTKTFAATMIRSLYLLAHATLRENYKQPVNVKVGGRWQQATPSKWIQRTGVEVKIGMSPGERARRAATLYQLLQSQIALADKGMEGVLVNVEGFYNTLMDWARVSGVENPERYFIDPRTDAAKDAMQAKQQAAQQQGQMREQLMAQAVLLEKFGVMLDKYKADQETQFKYWDGTLKAEIEEAKIVGKATTTLLAAKEVPDDTTRRAAAEVEPAAA